MTWVIVPHLAGYSEMLRDARELEHQTLRARDGDIGRVCDFYFDARTWAIRYLVVETGAWLASRKVLISPEAVAAPVWADRVIPVRLTRDQVQESPPMEAMRSLSRQYEILLRQHFDWPDYWTGSGLSLPGAVAMANPPLHRMHDVVGARLHATDGEIGAVAGFLVDDAAWKIRFLVADTRGWLPGRQVMLAPAQITAVDWSRRSLRVDMDRAAVKACSAGEPERAVAPDHLTDPQRRADEPSSGFTPHPAAS